MPMETSVKLGVSKSHENVRQAGLVMNGEEIDA